MESKKINQLATELSPELSDLTIIGDPNTGISKKITLSQMASLFTGTVEEYASLSAFPLVGAADTIYIALDTNIIYRWNTGTSAYVELSPNIVTSLVFSDANGFDGTISLVGSTATLTITTALTTGSVAFIGASGALTQDNSNFYWDNTNKRLGIGTNAPTTAIDTFGSGIITRVNGTSTNNAFIGFASAGTNKWSVGNVQSDHRFRIYNEATTSELVSVLQTGEFGIGIANPTTKLHIDGGASALIANLDANVSVAKSISFRSDNSNRINLEVSGTESGSNAGADLFIRTYTDAGALIETPLSIVRSTGVTTIKSLTLTNALSIANGGTGSTTQNFVDLTTTQSIGGNKTFTNSVSTSGLISTSDVRSNSGASDGQVVLSKMGGTNYGGGTYFAGDNGSSQSGFRIGMKYASSTSALAIDYSTNTQSYGANPTALSYSEAFRIALSNGAATFSNSLSVNTSIAGLASTITNVNDSSEGLLIRTSDNDSSLFILRLQSSVGATSQTWVDRFNFTKSGSFGIGITKPSARFSAGRASYAGISTPAILAYDGGFTADGGNGFFAGFSIDQPNLGDFSMLATHSGALVFGRYTNASDTSAITERMRITADGLNTYIGKNATGNFQLSVDGFGNYVFNNAISGGYRNYLNYALATYMITSNAGNTGMYMSSGGSSWNVFTSDIRVKKNFEPSQGLNELLQIEAVKYHMLTDEDDAPKRLGFKAQNLLPLIPEMVTTNPMALDDNNKPLYTITPDYLLPVLVKSIQELESRVKQLEA